MAKAARHFPDMVCFVIMPFGSRSEYADGRQEADFVYRTIITPAIGKALGIDITDQTVVREPDNNESRQVTKAIIQRIAEAQLVIADLTGHNANVFLEIGMRYALRKSGTIIIKQKQTEIPFDIANFRVHTYDKFAEDAADRLSEAIVATMNTRPVPVDSPVFEVFPDLQVDIALSPASRMPWNDYKERIDRVRELLVTAAAAPKDSGDWYIPDAIIGITKGGAAFADAITQKMPKYKGATLALWADRVNISARLFDNRINRNLLEGVKDHCGKSCEDLRILLVDEIVASGNTYREAVRLVREALPGCHLRFLPMVYKEDKNYGHVADTILWAHHAFRSKVPHDQIEALHLVSWNELPWGNYIRRE